MSTRIRRRPAQLVLVGAALVAAVAHVPVTPEHLREAPYTGVLFVLLTGSCLLLAVALTIVDRPALYVAAAVECGSAIAGYVLTRLVAFPEVAADVGNWLEPLGVVSVLAEAVVVIAAARLLLRPQAAWLPAGRRAAT